MTRRRYFTLRKAYEDDEWVGGNEEMERNLTVYEPEARPQETGLYDKNGAPLYALDDREPIGFIHFKREARSSK